MLLAPEGEATLVLARFYHRIVEKSDRSAPTAKQDSLRPGLAPALGLRAGDAGFAIVSQTNL